MLLRSLTGDRISAMNRGYGLPVIGLDSLTIRIKAMCHSTILTPFNLICLFPQHDSNNGGQKQRVAGTLSNGAFPTELL